MDYLERLLEGNKRFIENKPLKRDFKEERERVVNGQKPYVTILSCSDSRVVPEYIFDAGIGEIFTVINAGNICDSSVLGSIEYGVEHLKTPLLILLGHSKCGAVTATCGCGGKKSGTNIDYIIEKITPAIAKGDIEEAICENLNCIEKEILEKSQIVKEFVNKGKLKIIKMKYFLEDGEVKILKG
ncbi:MAG: carbonic anhydrase [Candidatus ainarchaeum sp.]|nr:carbonic anhydrase [Candidatus ainarchaeum sp.]